MQEVLPDFILAYYQISGVCQCFSKLRTMNLCIIHRCTIMEGPYVIFGPFLMKLLKIN